MNRPIALALLVASGCAAARAEQARQDALRRQLDARALPAPLDDTWRAALRLLAEAGYPLVGADREVAGQPARNAALELLARGHATRPEGLDGRVAATATGPQRIRYRIKGFPAPGGSRVTFERLDESSIEPAQWREDRDLAMEVALWRKVDPQGAAGLEAGGAAPTPTSTPTATPTPTPTSTSTSTAADKASATFDPWAPVRSLLGSWEGEGQGRSGVSQVSWTFELVLRGRYLQLRGTSVFEPQPANPTGEKHEEVSLFSWDKRRMALVWRQFNVEGFVNQFVLEKEEGQELTFVTEAIEGLPPGFRAREVLRRVGPDELHTRFSIAAPGRDFELYAENRLRRVR